MAATGEAVIVGEGPAARALRQRVRRLARSRSTVLLSGETGVGKGLVARCLYAQSEAGRAGGRFVHVDCAALAPSVIESELFGHERGAFTGAVARRSGRFELAGDGLLFLDEVAELPPRLQAKLLRVLQDRAYERVGGSRPLTNRARVVAATNRDLPGEIAAGRFRADLYYRLQVVELAVPPLRERLEDLPLLAGAAAREVAARLGVAPPRLGDGFLARLADHAWPGNVRELWNLIERLLVLEGSGPWTEAQLVRALAAPRPMPLADAPPESRSDFEARERRALQDLLAQHRWNVSATARHLGWSRGALRGRMLRLGL